MKLALIMGAGASIPFAPVLTSSFLTKELHCWDNWTGIISRVPSAINVSKRDIRRIVRGILSQTRKETNFEHIIEIIDKVCGYYANNKKSLFNKEVNIIRRSNKDKGGNRNCYAIIPFLAREIIADAISSSLKNGLDSELLTKQGKFIKFLASKSNNVSIISFNYDYVLDRTLDAINSKDYPSPYFCNGFTKESYGGYEMDFEKLAKSSNSIVFPHGSILFNHKGKDRLIYHDSCYEAEVDRWLSLIERCRPKQTSVGQQGVNSIDFNTFIVSGQTKETTMKNAPFNRFYQKAVDDIYKSDVIVIIGYSFHDDHINSVLSYYVETRKDYKIIVVDKQEINDAIYGPLNPLMNALSTNIQVNGNSDKKGTFRINNYDQLVKDKDGWISEKVYYYAKGYDEFLKEYEQIINKKMNL